MHTHNASTHMVGTYIQPSERGHNQTGLPKDSILIIITTFIIIKCIYTILYRYYRFVNIFECL